MVWECKHTMITIKDAQGLPGQRLHLVVCVMSWSRDDQVAFQRPK